MTGILTATSEKSSYFYVFILLLIGITVAFSLFSHNSATRKNLDAQALRSIYSAFKNSIYLANMQFIAKNQPTLLVDNWLENGVGLDFNQQGFPVGTDLKAESNRPMNAQNCLQIWQFLMGPLQNELVVGKSHIAYWVESDPQGNCIFHSPWVKDSQIRYQPSTGKVVFLAVNP